MPGAASLSAVLSELQAACRCMITRRANAATEAQCIAWHCAPSEEDGDRVTTLDFRQVSQVLSACLSLICSVPP